MQKVSQGAGLVLGGAAVILLNAALFGLAILFLLWFIGIVR